MLERGEAAAVAEEFGVADEQIRRDHLLSHLLAVLSTKLPRAVVFFGGTALARTHLPGGRLSEDLDLYAVPRRADVVADVEKVLADGVRREYGRLTWDPPLSSVRDVDPAVLRTADGLTVRVQLLDPAHHPAWPTERRALVQRYSDAPRAKLAVPTAPAFAAAKTTAWQDRHTPRDLYDLWGLARLGLLDMQAARLFAAFGPTGHAPRPWMFTDPPAADSWTTELGGQTRIAVGPAEALAVVRDAWTAALGRAD
ncbi:MAG: nucleotidyl transferase AbiEii/AbiGii toxin family protein [Haloechinothrix sp.]